MEPIAATMMDAGAAVSARKLGASLSGPKQLLILLINYWTFLNVVAIGLTLGMPWARFRWRLLAGLLLLYLVPPLVARIIRCLAPVREGTHPRRPA
jgi:predicted Na+-dependent transporter